jgi:hypothetical protein
MRKTGWIVRIALAVTAATGLGMNSKGVFAQYPPFESVAAVDSFAVGYAGNVPPLFTNYFTVGASDQATAAMYISPRYVPGWVGNTYITYQPFYPHEFLYTHKDRYHNYYNSEGADGLNRTRAVYYNPPVRTAARWIQKSIELPR